MSVFDLNGGVARHAAIRVFAIFVFGTHLNTRGFRRNVWFERDTGDRFDKPKEIANRSVLYGSTP
ncbi:hypothetical protein [Caballeronia sp. GAFFF2]|uniref:hypothetical protein n=1 Tax=Caballeronia sp. GAFFF2 TaxID=2921741 RepID=UPI002028E2E1|nr:hypothetical protein [Caballeronia sp. GAFFF2]